MIEGKKIDCVISFDTTGSMAPCLAEVRRNVREVIGQLFEMISGIRIGVIAHGDYCDFPRIMEVQDLSRNLSPIQKFVSGVKPTSGGDWSECYELVLHRARSLDWRTDADTRVLILIGDATPHERGYVYHEQQALHDWRTECQALKERGVVVYAVQAMGSIRRTKETAFYEKVAALTGGVKIDLHQLSHVLQLIPAVCYQQAGPEAFEAYEGQVRKAPMFNRALARMIDSVAGRKKPFRFAATKTDLAPVEPARFQTVRVDVDCTIKAFVVDEMGVTFKTGRGFYQLIKSETVQEQKEVILRDKRTGDMWSGPEARQLIRLPYGARAKISPKSLPADVANTYDVFVQSTSYNRKLKGKTDFLYESSEWDISA
jgi:hypothetical protein